MNAHLESVLECTGELALPEDMRDLVKPEYSKREVVNAGKFIARRGIQATDEAIELFGVAHNWRDSYVVPMMRVRQELGGMVRRVQRGAVTAARLKRMQSIRRKLQTQPWTLYQIQDIGGCRAIMSSLDDANRLAEIYRSGDCRHRLNKENDYIENPKSDGYRSLHFIFKFQGVGDEAIYNRQFIELQIRTQLQHSWATAVEAVGLVRNQNLKAGQGSPDWLRFFEIMSSEFAIEENCALVPGVSENQNERRSELRDLEQELSAIKRLDAYNQAIQYAEIFVGSGSSRYFIIQYDYENKEVTVTPYDHFSQSSAQYIEEERRHGARNTVLVEVDKVDDLKVAYPNYFLDVRLFTSRLKNIIYGPGSDLDLSWLKDYKR